MPKLEILGPTGHVELKWDNADPASVAKAESEFKTMLKAGFSVFSMNKDGTKGEQVDVFDSKVEVYVVIPPMQGG